jgi:hypothetical protein
MIEVKVPFFENGFPPPALGLSSSAWALKSVASNYYQPIRLK